MTSQYGGVINLFLLSFQPHESELSYYKTNKDTSGSDNDSVLSSSPPSLSPQPGTYPNNSDIWQMVISVLHIFVVRFVNKYTNFAALTRFQIIGKTPKRLRESSRGVQPTK